MNAAVVRGASLPLAPFLLLGQNLYSRYSTKNAYVHAQLLSHVQLFVTPWTVAHQPPLSMGFSRQEFWSELPFPSPGDLLNPRIEPASLGSPALADGFFTTEPPAKPILETEKLLVSPGV